MKVSSVKHNKKAMPVRNMFRTHLKQTVFQKKFEKCETSCGVTVK